MAGLRRLAGVLRQASVSPLPALSSLAPFSAADACTKGPSVVCCTREFTTGSGLAWSPVHIEDEPYCRQRQLITLGNRVSRQRWHY